MQAKKGTGSLRERRPGVWEIRVAAGVDAASGRTVQRSVTFRGDAGQAQQYRQLLAAESAARTAARHAAPLMTVGQLLRSWLAAEHAWRPSTAVGYASVVRALLGEPVLARARAVGLSPRTLRAVMAAWQAGGASAAVVAGRFRVLRSAIGWAYAEQGGPVTTIGGTGIPAPSSRSVRLIIGGAGRRVSR